jgi:hypothetical protein
MLGISACFSMYYYLHLHFYLTVFVPASHIYRFAQKRNYHKSLCLIIPSSSCSPVLQKYAKSRLPIFKSIIRHLENPYKCRSCSFRIVIQYRAMSRSVLPCGVLGTRIQRSSKSEWLARSSSNPLSQARSRLQIRHQQNMQLIATRGVFL